MAAATNPEPHDASADAGETIGATPGAADPSVEKDPSDWVSGDDPMTAAQRSYLDTLAREAGEELPASLTKAEASQHIERLQGGRDEAGAAGSQA
ncbi:DUF3072 domain-containing protein [Agrococcus sp. 1P02AA]|uniref:DUF3072 domain-containing protein n=1 Tax=Agrococcus sp. 1P02AA TaxID=3132259 RepID=UPI0039A6D870